MAVVTGKATGDATTSAAFRYGNPAVACGDAEVRAQCRQLATVLTVTGVIDETDVDLVAAQARRCVLPEKPFILDLSGVTSFTLSGIAQFLKGDFAMIRTAGDDAWDITSPDGVRAEASLSRVEAEDILEACRREASGTTEADEVAQAILDAYATRILA